MSATSNTFPWLDAAEWTAVGTVLLTAVTIVYVVLTYFTSRCAAASAASAAEAAAKSAAVAEAGLNVDFAARYYQEEETGDRWVIVDCTGATVFLCEVEIDLGVYTDRAGKLKFLFGPMEILDPPELPLRIHRGESATFDWHGDWIDLEHQAGGSVVIKYTVEDGGASREIRRVIDFGSRKTSAS